MTKPIKVKKRLLKFLGQYSKKIFIFIWQEYLTNLEQRFEGGLSYGKSQLMV